MNWCHHKKMNKGSVKSVKTCVCIFFCHYLKYIVQTPPPPSHFLKGVNFDYLPQMGI